VKFYLFLFVLLLGLSGCGTKGKTPIKNNAPTPSSKTVQHSGSGNLVIKPINFSKDAYIRDAVKQECKLRSKLFQFIEEHTASQYANILTDTNAGSTDAQILSIEIEQVQGGGGGAWSGGKMVLLKGTLTQNGRVLGDFKARRYSGGGVFGGYKGTCAILGRCVKALGKDIAEWLRHPTSQAALGDL